MNRAQKNAWFGLGFCMVADFLIAFVFYLSCTFPTVSKIFGGVSIAMLAFAVLLLCSFIFRRRRLGNIGADERDRYIYNAAIKISFITVWPLLILANILAIYFAGVAGPIPAILFAFIHLWVFVFCATIYFSSILILYKIQGGSA